MSGGVSRGFADLHARSGFSFGFGVATPEELVAAAVRMRIPSLALTDWDGLYGIHRFLAAGGAGVSPIVGAEVSTAGVTSCCWPSPWRGTVPCAGSSRITGPPPKTIAVQAC